MRGCPSQTWDLVVTLDDATSEHTSMFFCAEEGTDSSFHGIRQTIARHGMFCSLYTDRGSHYFHTPEAGNAFVPYIGAGLPDILCSQFERTVDNDNCVSFEARKLQILSSSHRTHYVKACVRVHRYVDGTMELFHGPRRLAVYDTRGQPIERELKQAA